MTPPPAARSGETEEFVSETPLRTRGVLYEHVFGAEAVLQKHHGVLCPGPPRALKRP